jgi:hypothetical protein
VDFTITIQGNTPLLMHNAQLSDPLNPFTRRLSEVTKKRSKTIEDHQEIALREWDGSLYYDPDAGPYIPGANINRCLLDAARLRKLGKSLERGLLITTDVNPLAYDGPRSLDKLRGDVNHRHMASVKIGQSRTMRCRPVFRSWSVECSGWMDEEMLNPSDFALVVEQAGRYIGLGDWRPRFGRFDATFAAA